jgi:hypothetical protein
VSTPGGSIPQFVSERSIQGKIAEVGSSPDDVLSNSNNMPSRTSPTTKLTLRGSALLLPLKDPIILIPRYRSISEAGTS